MHSSGGTFSPAVAWLTAFRWERAQEPHGRFASLEASCEVSSGIGDEIERLPLLREEKSHELPEYTA